MTGYRKIKSIYDKIKIKYNEISIKWKVFAYLLCFCGLLLFLLWLFQVVFLDSFYKRIKINEVKNSASSIIRNFENENLSDLIEQLSVRNDVCIEILSENGAELYSSHILSDCIIHKIPPVFDRLKLFHDTVDNGGELLGYFNRNPFPKEKYDRNMFIGRVPRPPQGMNESIVFSKIITGESGERAILVINSIISPVDATVNTLRIQLYYITGFMILFSVILALIITKKVSRPIEEINQSAKILALGKYDVTFNSVGYKEIKELSDTLAFTAKELSKVENLRRELIANVSHDLRTPLTLIRGYAEAIRDLPDENNPENAQIIIDETQRLTDLVNDMLDISKLQSGVQVLNLSEFNITQMVAKMIERIQELVKKHGYNIKFIYDTEVNVMADEMRISQAFYNLLTNAINYTGDDKVVVVKQSCTESHVKIEVIDTGEGIAPEDLPYIWDRYYKVDKSHKRAVMGTGLGLSIVKSIIEMHKGEYGVSSKLNGGSVFWFALKINGTK